MALMLISAFAMATQNEEMGLLPPPPRIEVMVTHGIFNENIFAKPGDDGTCTVSTTRSVNDRVRDCEGHSYNVTATGEGSCTAETCEAAMNCAIVAAYHQAYSILGQLQFICPPQ